jgi:hypothetical protein
MPVRFRAYGACLQVREAYDEMLYFHCIKEPTWEKLANVVEGKPGLARVKSVLIS